MNDLLTAMVMITPITMALTDAVKRAAKKRIDVDQYAPIIAMLLGVGAAMIFPPQMTFWDEVAAGILSGLAASGLYSGTKSAVFGK